LQWLFSFYRKKLESKGITSADPQWGNCR